MSNKIVQITELRKQYRVGEVTINALRGIDLEFEQGDFAVIQGQSGSGFQREQTTDLGN